MTITLLRKISIAYLLLPNILFMVGWFKIGLAIPVVVILLYMFYKELLRRKILKEESISLFDITFLTFIGLTLTLLSGCGGYSVQVQDWWGHNSKFYDLYTSEWPYYFTEVNRLVRYYFGYYLVPSLIFKLIGGVVPSVIFAWTCLGFVIGISWIYILIYKNKFFLLLSLFFAGIGPLVGAIAYKLNFIIPGPIYSFVFYSIFDYLRWAPNQLIPVIITTSIMFYDSISLKRHDDSFFIISLTLVWAIFPFIALCVIYIILFFFYGNWRKLLSITTIANYLFPLICLIPTILFFASGNQPDISGFIWSFPQEGFIWYRYMIGIFLDALILLTIFLLINRSLVPELKLLVSILLITSLLLSIYRVGRWNDWFSKMSIPFLVTYLILFFNTLHRSIAERQWFKLRTFSKFFIIIIISFSFLQQLYIIKTPLINNVLTNSIKNEALVNIPYNKYGNFYRTMVEVYGIQDAEQYMSKDQSLYERYLSRRNIKPTGATGELK